MAIIFSSTDMEHTIEHPQRVKQWIKETVAAEKHTLGDIAIVWCSDSYLLEVNRKYLQHDYFTDIITFDYNEDKKIAGDLIISVDRIKENAKEFGVMFHVEQLRVVIHGILHLCGYEDKEEAEQKIMRTKEDHYLSLYEI